MSQLSRIFYLNCGGNLDILWALGLPHSSPVTNQGLGRRLFSTLGTSTKENEPVLTNATTRGKKLRPGKPNIVVLDLKQSGLVKSKRGRPHFLKGPLSPLASPHISILEGVDLDPISEKTSFKGLKSIKSVASENSATTDDKTAMNLLQFMSKSTDEQVVISIDSLKPLMKTVSSKVFDGLTKELTEGYTVKQLKHYIRTKFVEGVSTNNLIKAKLTNVILNKIWKLEISNTLKTESNCSRQIKLNDIQTKLLILTQDGKILKNLSRLDKNILIQLDILNNHLNLWGNDSILKYIEISINKILKNVSIDKWVDNPDTSHIIDPKIISRITRLCGVDINLKRNEIASFGRRRIELAKRMLLWSKYITLENDPRSPYIRQELNNVDLNELGRWFPFSDFQSLNWLLQTEQLERFQQSSVINTSSILGIPSNGHHNNILNKVDEIITFLNNKDDPIPTGSTISNIVGISLGQILKRKDQLSKHLVNKQPNSEGVQYYFQPTVTDISWKLEGLPISIDNQYEGEMFTSMDQHDYYLQLILSPDQNQISVFGKNEPLELWLQLNVNNQINIDSIQAIIPILKENYLIQSPDSSYDYKISNDHICNIPVSLEEQPDLLSYINKIQYNYNIDSFKTPPSLMLNSPLNEDMKIKYNYVTCNRHKILKLKYLDKYDIQYSEVDGGHLGGKTNHLDFICNKSKPTSDELTQFIEDVSKF